MAFQFETLNIKSLSGKQKKKFFMQTGKKNEENQ